MIFARVLENNIRVPRGLSSGLLNRIHRAAAAICFRGVMGNFQREQDSSYGKWDRWAGGLTVRPTKRGGTKMLQDTGRLRGSILPEHDDRHAAVFTTVEYARAHNHGHRYKGKRPRILPRREFMYMTEAVQKEIDDAAHAIVEQELRRAL